MQQRLTTSLLLTDRIECDRQLRLREILVVEADTSRIRRMRIHQAEDRSSCESVRSQHSTPGPCE